MEPCLKNLGRLNIRVVAWSQFSQKGHEWVVQHGPSLAREGALLQTDEINVVEIDEA